MRVFILLSVIAVALADLECSENQHYESCGTACPLTCENYENPPLFCILMCNPGCHCDEGYVKTEDGRCVKPEQCPAQADQCGENQHYESCGTACPLTCENYKNPPRACILMCNPGCHCDEGYVKTEDGRCVKPGQCPAQADQVCGENERYTTCGTACPLTCDNHNNPPKICPLMCLIGCECEKGFIKSRDGRCIRPEECPSQTPFVKSCVGKPDPGMCRAYMPSWYYDAETGNCKKFIYGGCQGNGNRYATEEDCMHHCFGIQETQTDSETCDLPAVTGNCMAYFERFHFDRKSGQCKRFIYGGCGGNKNNFKTIEECQNACGLRAATNVCSLPKVSGNCLAFFPRYYYDEETGSCQKFIYGGCGGNENNFRTLSECQQTCDTA